MKKQKGITLIALIITIIVMLILVAVTINVALNGGIFNKAKDASDKTNLAKEEEILQTTALGYLQKNTGYVDLKTFAEAYEENGIEGYTLTYVGAKDYVTASNGTNTFYITKQGGITEEEPQAEDTNILIGKIFKMSNMDSETYQNVEEYKVLEFIDENNGLCYYEDEEDGISFNYSLNGTNIQISNYSGEETLENVKLYKTENNIVITFSIDGQDMLASYNKGADITPLTGLIFKNTNNEDDVTEFSTKSGYGINNNLYGDPSTYAIINDTLYLNDGYDEELKLTKQGNNYTEIIKESEKETKTYRLVE